MKQTLLKSLFAVVLLLIATSNLSAQTMSVASFEAVPNDMSAMQQGTKLLDQNGDPCAIIKIQTTEKGFTYDVGSLGIVKTEEKVGEIWVYVPFGVNRITLHHPTLKAITYQIPTKIEKGRVYKMELTTDNVIVIRKQGATQQFVVFNLTPKNAIVELDGQLLATDNGVATKLMKFGTYNYKVQAPDCYAQTGTITVNDAKQKHVIDIVLKSSKSSVTVTVGNNAQIWINGEQKGVGSWKGELGKGEYLLEAKLAGYYSTSESVTIGESETRTITLDAPVPIHGGLSIQSSPSNAKVFIDGKNVGETPLLLQEILIGNHLVQISKEGYANIKKNVLISEGKTCIVDVTLSEVPNDEIWYTSTNGQIIGPNEKSAFDATIVSNTYSGGKGVIKFNKEITKIGEKAFWYCERLASINIPTSVITLEKNAFSYCSGLKSISIPNSVTSIGESVFLNCKCLKDITVPNSVTKIGSGAFSNCVNLESVTIPNSINEIRGSTFSDCPSLASITIPNSVTKIGYRAFDGCSRLTNVEIPNSITHINDAAFSGCSGLTSITIPDSVTSIGAYTFFNCKGLTSVTIPNSVTSIGKFAFSGCSSLISVTIPDSVTSIGDEAFSWCKALTSVIIPSSVKEIGVGVFRNCSRLLVPKNIKKKFPDAFK